MLFQTTKAVRPPLAPLVYSAVTAMAATLLLPFPRTAMIHTALAVGVMPLILAAMIYFTPTLTRTPPARGWAWSAPWLTLVAGLLAVAGFSREERLLIPAAMLAILAVGQLTLWLQQRRSRCLGSPHGGLLWYQAALGCLLLGLLTILAALAWPDWHVRLRPIHLHLNLLGFVGMTALGTLNVLLPTVAGYSDPRTPARLARDWPWALIGTLLVAGGSGWWPLATTLGVASGLLAPLSLLQSVVIHRQTIVTGSGASHGLVVALAGYLLLWPLSLGFFWPGWDHSNLTLFYIWGFILPLVTSAASHLLPLWWRPEPPQAFWRQQSQQRLARWGGGRAALFLLAAIGFFLGSSWAVYGAAAGLLLFAGQMLHARLGSHSMFKFFVS